MRTQRTDLEFNGCPLCRNGGTIDYTTFFPGTESYYPQNVAAWSNPEYLGRKGIQDEMTQVEREWITQNWGNILDRVNKEELERGGNYIILNHNNYMYGCYNSVSRSSNRDYLFDNCKILCREGRYYNTSPPTRNMCLDPDNIQIYQIV